MWSIPSIPVTGNVDNNLNNHNGKGGKLLTIDSTGFAITDIGFTDDIIALLYCE
jgi:hypothetical protein